MNETDYDRGNRVAWRIMLGSYVRQLGYDDPESKAVQWIIERESAVEALRAVCEKYGDLEWSPDLHLADVIQNHLRRHLEARPNS